MASPGVVEGAVKLGWPGPVTWTDCATVAVPPADWLNISCDGLAVSRPPVSTKRTGTCTDVPSLRFEIRIVPS